MFYLGIDIAKHEHCATVHDDQGKIVLKPFKFPANKAGFNLFFEKLNKATDKSDNSSVLVGMEATGHYWMTLYEVLIDREFQVVVFNPLQVSGHRNQNIRGRKSDKDDAKLIARILRFGEHRITTLADEEMLKMREMCRLRTDFAHRIGDLKKRIISVLDKTFPEYDGFFSDTFGKSSKAILSDVTSPEEIITLDTAKLTEILKKASRNQLGKAKAEDLKSLAEESVGLGWGKEAFNLQIRMILEQIELLEKQVKILELNIAEIYRKQNVKLDTIPGVGDVLAANILAEIGDINRFEKDRGRQLIAFAGLDPKIRESGKFRGKVKMTKRGSPYLRTAIYLASDVARQHNDMFSKIYHKQMSLGKKHKVAVSHVANKMCHVIYAILRDGVPFDENRR